jgi:Zn-dependent protease
MQGGAFRLFRFAGIQVYLHFTWFLVAAFQITRSAGLYSSPIWSALEYIGLFVIVLLHEFGHALACRQTGGVADRIILWPLGGIAFVNPPPRPGAYLWSIVAGPLVNVALLPVLLFASSVAEAQWRMSNHDAYRFIYSLWYVNAGLLIFNLLPIYPLDGGQIVRGLLWFAVGQIRSLKIASVIGLIGAIIFMLLAIVQYIIGLQQQAIWLGILAFFILSQAQAGWRYAKQLALEAETAGAPPMETPPPIPGQHP